MFFFGYSDTVSSRMDNEEDLIIQTINEMLRILDNIIMILSLPDTDLS